MGKNWTIIKLKEDQHTEILLTSPIPAVADALKYEAFTRQYAAFSS